MLKTFPQYKGMTAVCNNDPYLNGDWGDLDLATMTEQAIMLGIPSVQLEIPLKMRQTLFKDEKLSKQFLNVIIKVYHDIVCNWWPARVVPLVCDREMGAMVDVRAFKKGDVARICGEYTEWEKK